MVNLNEEPESSTTNDNWRTPSLRQAVITKLNDIIRRVGIPVIRSGTEMESHVFAKAKTREEYMGLIAKIILYIREIPHAPLPRSRCESENNEENDGENEGENTDENLDETFAIR